MLGAGADAVALGGGGLAGALLPELVEAGLITRFRLGERLELEAGDRMPGVRLASDAPPTDDCLDGGAEGFFGLSTRGAGANECREVRGATVGGGAIDCRLASGFAEGGPIDEGAIEALFPAVVPLILGRGALAADVVEEILEGRGLGTGVAGFPFAFGGGRVGCSSISIDVEGCINSPWLGGQSKYRSPRTDPSFLPSASSNARPIHEPSLKETPPMNLIVPTRPSPIRTFCPTLNCCAMFTGGVGSVSSFREPPR